MSIERKLVKVVPGDSVDGGPQPTRGTQVLMPSGEAIPWVTRITLTADVKDVWRAQIECLASLDDITALADIKPPRQDGTEPIEERLARIEAKLDALLEQTRPVRRTWIG